MFTVDQLKEYYEIVGKSRPLSAFSPKHAVYLTEMHTNHETKQSSKFQSNYCFIICSSVKMKTSHNIPLSGGI